MVSDDSQSSSFSMAKNYISAGLTYFVNHTESRQTMADKFNPDDSSIDLETFQDWVTQTAEAEGTTPEEVIQQLMSTYWILNELMETIEGTSYEQLIDEDSVPAQSQRNHVNKEGSQSEMARNDIVDVIKAIAEFNNTSTKPAPERSGETIDPNLIDIIEALQSDPQHQQPTRVDPSYAHASNQIEALRDKIASLRDDVEDLNESVEDIQVTTQDTVEGVRNRLSQLEQSTEELRANQRQISDRSEAKFSEITDTLEAMRDRLNKKADQSDIEDIESMTVKEFNTIERAFEQLLKSIEEVEEELESTTGSNTQDLDKLFEHQEELRQLDELKQLAMRKGIEKGVCENCKQNIHLPLLSSPYCPNCDRRLSRIEPSGWNPLKSHRIITEPLRSVASSE